MTDSVLPQPIRHLQQFRCRGAKVLNLVMFVASIIEPSGAAIDALLMHIQSGATFMLHLHRFLLVAPEGNLSFETLLLVLACAQAATIRCSSRLPDQTQMRAR